MRLKLVVTKLLAMLFTCLIVIFSFSFTNLTTMASSNNININSSVLINNAATLEISYIYTFEATDTNSKLPDTIFNWNILSRGDSGKVEIEKQPGTDGRKVIIKPLAAGTVEIQVEARNSRGELCGSSQKVVLNIIDTMVQLNIIKNAIAHNNNEIGVLNSSTYRVSMEIFNEIYHYEKPFTFVNNANKVKISFDGNDLPYIDKSSYSKNISLLTKVSADRTLRQSISNLAVSYGYKDLVYNTDYKVVELADEKYPCEAKISADLGTSFADLAFSGKLYVYEYSPKSGKITEYLGLAKLSQRTSNYVSFNTSKGGTYILSSKPLNNDSSSNNGSSSSASTSQPNNDASSRPPIPLTAEEENPLVMTFVLLTTLTVCVIMIKYKINRM